VVHTEIRRQILRAARIVGRKQPTVGELNSPDELMRATLEIRASDGDFPANLIKATHREVDEYRKARGLAPFPWADEAQRVITHRKAAQKRRARGALTRLMRTLAEAVK
jgi:5-carboxymethyl-2-hydroxymuconate isomerase